MGAPIFSEVIKIKDGCFYNLEGHTARVARTCQHFFGRPPGFKLTPEALPAPPSAGLVKCRLVYSDVLKEVEYSSYSIRKIGSLALRRVDQLHYPFKFTDRSAIQELTSLTQAEDILVVQHEAITDTSFANVVFKCPEGLFTPSTCLLPGTKRELLLRQGRIRERPIFVSDLGRFEEIYLINAMIDLEDEVSAPVTSLKRHDRDDKLATKPGT